MKEQALLGAYMKVRRLKIGVMVSALFKLFQKSSVVDISWKVWFGLMLFNDTWPQ